MKPIISVENLSKHYTITKRQPGTWGAVRGLFHTISETVRAVDGISFQIQPGELVGYLGPNGAGKSTTIKMLTGLLTPTAGKAQAIERVPWKERQAYVAKIGAVFGQRVTLWWDLPVIESLDLLQYIYRIPKGRFQRNLQEFRQLLDMEPFLHTPVRSLSLGQRMRAEICAALLHNPMLLFLDEPTIGLDVVAKERIRQFIRQINRERGTTVLLTTHDLTDVEKLCERVMIIDKGRLLYDGGLEALRARFGGKRRLLVEMTGEYPSYTVEGAQEVANEPSGDGRQVTYEFERDAISASDLIGRLSQQYRIRDLQVREPDIEETIRRIYEERLLE